MSLTPAQLSFVAAPNTMTAPETPTSTKMQCLLIPGRREKGQEYKGQEKREELRKQQTRGWKRDMGGELQ